MEFNLFDIAQSKRLVDKLNVVNDKLSFAVKAYTATDEFNWLPSDYLSTHKEGFIFLNTKTDLIVTLPAIDDNLDEYELFKQGFQYLVITNTGDTECTILIGSDSPLLIKNDTITLAAGNTIELCAAGLHPDGNGYMVTYTEY